MAPRNPTAFPARNYVVPQDLAAQHVHALGDTQGMTLRDYFAAKALTGLIHEAVMEGKGVQIIEISADAYRIADAMLAERDKGGK